MTEIYFSCDIEADGPIPGQHSMLSLGVAAFLPEGGTPRPCATWSANMLPLDGAAADPETMRWWGMQPDAWAECRRDPGDPAVLVPVFRDWVDEVAEARGAKPVFVGYPATYDFMFVYWYLVKFGGRSPFGFQGLDVKSYAMALLGTEFKRSAKSNFPKRWFGGTPHTHRALDDAIGQGELFMNMLHEGRALGPSNE